MNLTPTTVLSERCPKCGQQMFNHPRSITRCAKCGHEWAMKEPEAPFTSNERGKTHWDGCWRTTAHHACAVEEIERLIGERDAMQRRAESAEGDWQSAEAERDRLRAVLDMAQKQLGALAALILQDDREGAKDWARGVTIVIGKDGAPIVALSGEPTSAHETREKPAPKYTGQRDEVCTLCGGSAWTHACTRPPLKASGEPHAD